MIELLIEGSNNGVIRYGELGKVAEPFGAHPREYSTFREDELLAEGSR